MAHQASPENFESAAHEKDQVSVRGIVHFAIWFVIVAVVVHLLVWVIFRSILHYNEKQYEPVSALFPQSGQVPPPEPQLQPTAISHEALPHQDTARMLEREDAEFQRRGWDVDTKKHKVTISRAVADQVLAMSRNAPAPPATRPSEVHARTQPPARPLEQIGMDR